MLNDFKWLENYNENISKDPSPKIVSITCLRCSKKIYKTIDTIFYQLCPFCATIL